MIEEDVGEYLKNAVKYSVNLAHPNFQFNFNTDFEWWNQKISQIESVEIGLSANPRIIDMLPFKSANDKNYWIEQENRYGDVHAGNSTSIFRAPGALEDYVRGSVNQLPFMPGGVSSLSKINGKSDVDDEEIERFFEFCVEGKGEFQLIRKTTVGGLQRGLALDGEKEQGVGNEEKGMSEAQKMNMDFLALFQNTYMKDLEADEEDFQEQKYEAKVERKVKKADNDETAQWIYDQNAQLKVMDSEVKAEEGKEQKESLTRKTSAASKTASSMWGIMEPLKDQEQLADFYDQIPELAIQYPFELDPFQKQAILHLERNESVFVAAHTSAGKTVVAEYAIALCSKHLTRAVYTSPIKTLSNQKYREFKKLFGDVGLITGDVSINPQASCLILTTEILRSMLYKGADLIRDIEWLIFDEVHYVNDAERGVVWEEVIIMLPEHVNIIMLSATVPNTLEFADWVGRTKQRKVYIISTSKRPVPLQHYLWAQKELFLIVDSNSQFFHHNFERARFVVLPKKDKDRELASGKKSVQTSSAKKSGGLASQKTQWIGLINHLRSEQLLPSVVFSLSKKKCELSVQGLQSLDLTNQAEKSSIHVMTETALSRLKSEDRELPQILRVSEMLKRGIGIHHSGLLPIVKELVEMVFSKGLVKVLFATETFAMGVNMPTRTVVFNGLRKFDGRTFRDIYPGEYTQMAGRAGRRGLDSFGTVIINCADNELPDETVCQQMILGKPTKLISQFRLTYNMILNLMRVEDIRVEDMIKRSFGEFNSQKDVPEKQMNLEKQEEKLKRIDTGNSIVCMYDEPYLIDDYYEAFHQMNAANAWMMRFIINSKQGKKFLNPGRVVSVSKFGMIERPAIILSIENSDRPSEMCMYTVLILTPDGWSPDSTTRKIMSSEPITNVFHSSYLITVIRAANLIYISDRVLNINGASIRVDKKATEISKAVTSLRKLEDGIEEFSWLDPIENMNIDNLEFHDYYDKWNRAYSYLEGSKCHSCQKQESHFQLAQKKFLLKQQVNSLRLALSEDNIELISDFNLRVDVLKKLKYVNSDRTVQLKGRVACEINTCESLIVTEMIFENVFTSLSPEECVAILSCFVFQQKTDDQPKISDELAYALGKMISIATDLANLQKEHKIDISPQSFIHDNINPGLVEVVHEWAKGTPFKEICTLTTVEEGVIVRCITRLDETCRDLRNAARVIGDQKLFEKMENASTLIKRDIVFAASLYVT